MTIRNWAKNGLLRAHKIGNFRFYSRADVEQVTPPDRGRPKPVS